MSKKYEQGAADTIQAYEKFGEKQESAVRHVGDEIKKTAGKVNRLGDMIGEIADHISSREKAELYRLHTPIDIADLEDDEKQFLVAILYQLASDTETLSDEQRNYVYSVQSYLNIRNPQTHIDLNCIENVEDISTQKAILQVVLEFFRLSSGTEELTESQEDFLDSFQVNRKTRKEIEGHVDRIVTVVGLSGLAMKYGEIDSEIDNSQSEEEISLSDSKGADLSEPGDSVERKYEYEDIFNLVGSTLQNLYPTFVYPTNGKAKEQEEYENRKSSFLWHIETTHGTVAPKAIIDYIKSADILFTTAGLYFRNNHSLEMCYVRYSEIDFDRTDTLTGGSGRQDYIVLYRNGDNKAAKVFAPFADELLSMLKEAAKLNTAETDINITSDLLPANIKLEYCDVLLSYAALLNLDEIETLRLIQELSFSEEDFSSIVQRVVEHQHVSDLDFNLYLDRVCKLYDHIPYPSEDTVGRDLLIKQIMLIQLSTGRHQEITGKERNILVETANVFDIDREVLDSIIPLAQYDIRLLNGEISDEDDKTIRTVGGTFGAASGLLATTILLGPVGWVGAVGAGVLGGISVLGGLCSIGSNQDIKARKEARLRLQQKYHESYANLLNATASWGLLGDELIDMRRRITAAAEKNSITI